MNTGTCTITQSVPWEVAEANQLLFSNVFSYWKKQKLC